MQPLSRAISAPNTPSSMSHQATRATSYLACQFYTRDIIPENRTYDPLFRNLDGLPLEYELNNGTVRIRYRIARINLNPVPGSKFDIPTNGYREMKYEDSKKMN